VTERYKRNPNTTCVVCHKHIYKRPCEIERNKGRVYCGMNCYGISCRKETPCVVCGKPILAGRHKISCSRACANIYRARVGYKYNKPRDKVKGQRALKLRLLETRGRVCEKCGYNKYEILQVHHKDKDRSNNDIENLELICPNCHCEEHFLEKSWLRKLAD